MRAAIAAHVSHAIHDPRQRTAPARTAFRDSFDEKADPNGTMTEAERRRAGEQLYRAHMVKMAFESSKARSRKAAAKTEPTPVMQAEPETMVQAEQDTAAATAAGTT
jgi:hypothetical protein